MDTSNLLNPPAVSTARFTYVPDGNLFVADASDLMDVREGRVYADACDLGFTLYSARTGAAVVFVESREVRDADGDLLYTQFEPAEAQHDPRVRGKAVGHVRIFND